MVQRPSLLLFFLAVTISCTASDLRLFSYTNSQGQTIVVDSINRIPPQYRDRASSDFIPSFSTRTKDEKISSPRLSHPEKARPDSPDKTGLIIISPPEEELNPAIASASMITKDMRNILTNNERTYSLAMLYGINHHTVEQLHARTLSELQQIINPESITEWPEGEAWKAHAIQSLAQIRTLQQAMTRIIIQKSDSSMREIPDFFARMSARLSELENLLRHSQER